MMQPWIWFTFQRVWYADIWGGNRTELYERYANSMLALNASTGKLVEFPNHAS